MNGTPQMFTVNHMLSWGFRLQAHLAQRATAVLGWSPRAAPHLYHGSTTTSWQLDRRLHLLAKIWWWEMGDSHKPWQLSPGKHQVSTMSLLFSPAPISSLFLIFALSLFFVLLPECTSRVPCHGNTCRWRQSSSSTSFASAEEVTNHSTSGEVLSPRYPWTICKRGCPWSTRFSQVFSSLLRTSGKALFPLPASHHVPCPSYFTQSCKLPA